VPLKLAPLAASVESALDDAVYLGLPPPPDSSHHAASSPLMTEWVCLLLPTSLCSSEVARAVAAKLQGELGRAGCVRFVSLPHTEGCGVSDATLGARTLLGHVRAPAVAHAVLLEHGCEKTHNDYFAAEMRALSIRPDAFGWVSLQGDGGIANAEARIRGYFEARLGASADRRAAPLGRLGLALIAHAAPIADELALFFARLAALFARDGRVVLAADSPLLSHPIFLEAALAERPRTTLAFGERAEHCGLHVMEAPSGRWVETASGLGASGVHLMLAWRPATSPAPPGHPMVPMLTMNVHSGNDTIPSWTDIALPETEPSAWMGIVLRRLSETASGDYVPCAMRQTNLDFQLPRGGSCSL